MSHLWATFFVHINFWFWPCSHKCRLKWTYNKSFWIWRIHGPWIFLKWYVNSKLNFGVYIYYIGHLFLCHYFSWVKVTVKSDVHAFGNILFELLLGKKPFTGTRCHYTITWVCIANSFISPYNININIWSCIILILNFIWNTKPQLTDMLINFTTNLSTHIGSNFKISWNNLNDCMCFKLLLWYAHLDVKKINS